MSIIGWVIFGALAGWIAGMIAGTGHRGVLRNIIIGIVGAFLGGFLVEIATGNPVSMGWNWRSFGVAVLGSVVLLWVSEEIQRRRR